MFARQTLGRAAARIRAVMRSRRLPARLWRPVAFSPAVVAAGVVAPPQSALGATAVPGGTFTSLTLLNRRGDYSSATAAPPLPALPPPLYFKPPPPTTTTPT